MKILFASRHAPTQQQVDELRNCFSTPFELEQKNITFSDLQSVENAIHGYDFAIIVLPQTLAMRVGYEYAKDPNKWGKILTAESAPVFAEDGKIREFKHICFRLPNGEKLIDIALKQKQEQEEGELFKI